MKAAELRIGNWVMYSSKIQVNENKIRECVDHPDRFEPIPLTEEWLLKFGFINDIDEDWRNDILRLNADWNNEEGWFFYVNYNGLRPSEHIKHVHQLQNLYFALTGEELIIKL